MSKKIVVVDYGAGNILNVTRAFSFLGVSAISSASPEDVTSASAIVIPGVGDYGAGMEGLSLDSLDEAVRDFARSGKPVLGICLGMQLFSEKSEEAPGVRGLSLLPGAIVSLSHLQSAPVGGSVPDTGWCDVIFHEDFLSYRGGARSSFYFSHSYCMIPENLGVTIASKFFGAVSIPAIVKLENVVGFQFHPEKSGTSGLALLEDWVSNA